MPHPFRLSYRQFCDVVHEAVESLPEAFYPYLENVAVEVQNEPDERDLEILEDRDDTEAHELLGLFVGTPLTEQHFGDHLPNVIKIFRRPMERVSHSRESLLRQIRATVMHEFAHHFGFSEEELEAFEQRQAELDDEE